MKVLEQKVVEQGPLARELEEQQSNWQRARWQQPMSHFELKQQQVLSNL
jgi:hypothetical protein